MHIHGKGKVSLDTLRSLLAVETMGLKERNCKKARFWIFPMKSKRASFLCNSQTVFLSGDLLDHVRSYLNTANCASPPFGGFCKLVEKWCSWCTHWLLLSKQTWLSCWWRELEDRGRKLLIGSDKEWSTGELLTRCSALMIGYHGRLCKCCDYTRNCYAAEFRGKV